MQLAGSLPRVRIYATPNGRTPFTEWLEALKDQRGRDIIQVRVRCVSLGNFGDSKVIGERLYELRIFSVRVTAFILEKRATMSSYSGAVRNSGKRKMSRVRRAAGRTTREPAS